MVGHLGLGRIVRHHDHREARVGQLADQSLDTAFARRIKSRRWLVEGEDVGMKGEAPG